MELATGQIQSLEISAANNLTLSVNITKFNVPLTNITWTHGGNILNSGVDRVTVTNSLSLLLSPVMSTLHLTSLIPLDSGLYTITSSNPVGSRSLTFNVTVTGEF